MVNYQATKIFDSEDDSLEEDYIVNKIESVFNSSSDELSEFVQ